MPDIVSRIKLETQGSDQAVRDLLKLEEAYRKIGEAAKLISPQGLGGIDPFTQATAPGGGIPGAGVDDTVVREHRNQVYRNQANERERANKGYNSELRHLPGSISGSINAAQAAASGRGGAAIGGGLNMLGTLLGSGGLLAAGALAFGTQQLSEGAAGRLSAVWGSGLSQRLGQNYTNTQNIITGQSRTGIPLDMIMGLLNSASQSGFSLTGANVGRAGLAAEAAANLGVDPSVLGSMLGTFSRAGLGKMTNYDLFSTAKGAVGSPNISTFLTALSSTIEDALKKGIKTSPEEATRQTNLLAAFSQIGGLSPTGAAELLQVSTNRARNAAQLQSPEDVMALQAIRRANPGLSLTDAMMKMESDPTGTNRAVYNYLQRATGGDKDLMRIRLQKYLGASSMSMVNDFISTMGAYTPDSTKVGAGLVTLPWMNRSATGVSTSEERKTMASLQANLMKGVEEGALKLTTGITDMLGGTPYYHAEQVGLGGYNPTIGEDVNRAYNRTQEQTRQDISAAYDRINNSNMTEEEKRRAIDRLGNPMNAKTAAVEATIAQNSQVRDYLSGLYATTGSQAQSRWEDMVSGNGSAPGGWSQVMADVQGNMVSRIRQTIPRDSEGRVNMAIEGLTGALERAATQMASNDLTYQEFKSLMEEFKDQLAGQGFVYTDGQWTYQGH